MRELDDKKSLLNQKAEIFVEGTRTPMSFPNSLLNCRVCQLRHNGT
jgi:hypothetical protein